MSIAPLNPLKVYLAASVPDIDKFVPDGNADLKVAIAPDESELVIVAPVLAVPVAVTIFSKANTLALLAAVALVELALLTEVNELVIELKV